MSRSRSTRMTLTASGNDRPTMLQGTARDSLSSRPVLHPNSFSRSIADDRKSHGNGDYPKPAWTDEGRFRGAFDDVIIDPLVRAALAANENPAFHSFDPDAASRVERNVCLWPLSDVPGVLREVRSREQSGSDPNRQRLPGLCTKRTSREVRLILSGAKRSAPGDRQGVDGASPSR